MNKSLGTFWLMMFGIAIAALLWVLLTGRPPYGSTVFASLVLAFYVGRWSNRRTVQ